MLTLICLSMLVIAGCQCFHVFKLYSRLIAMEMLMNSILNKMNINEFQKKQESEKKPPANRRTRTDAEKAASSQKRKEWWEKKRALDAQKIPEPKLEVGSIPPQAALIPESKLNS